MGHPVLIPNVHKLLMKNSQETSRVCRAKRRHEEEGGTFGVGKKNPYLKRHKSDTKAIQKTARNNRGGGGSTFRVY